MFIYIWFEYVGWSHDPPTEEDHRTIEAGELLVVEIKGTDLPPTVWGGKPLEKCKTDTTPEGAEYHYV
jgi:hypothetical protein